MCTNTNPVVHVTAVLDNGKKRKITLCPGIAKVTLTMVSAAIQRLTKGNRTAVHFTEGPDVKIT